MQRNGEATPHKLWIEVDQPYHVLYPCFEITRQALAGEGDQRSHDTDAPVPASVLGKSAGEISPVTHLYIYLHIVDQHG